MNDVQNNIRNTNKNTNNINNDNYAGQLVLYLKEWANITSDSFILDIIQGYKIPFISKPHQVNIPKSKFSRKEQEIVQNCVDRLLLTGAIELAEPCPDQFISGIFSVPKTDGSHRLILNLKNLNEFLEYNHFKMEDYRAVCNILSEGMFMATIDLKDAYHLVSIHEESRKYLRFIFNDQLYQFKVLPFGLSTAPRIFSKLLKPVVSYLRERGILLVIFLDDIFIADVSEHKCTVSVSKCLRLLQNLGFIISKKSMLTTNTRVRYLGFYFDSKLMQLQLPTEKRQNILWLCQKILGENRISIQVLAEFVGTLIFASPAVTFGMFYTRQLEYEKTLALNSNNWDFTSHLVLSQTARADIRWWSSSILHTYSSLRSDTYDMTIYTDASKTGLGGHLNESIARGSWTLKQREFHINELELLAVYYVLKSFVSYVCERRVLLRVDSTVAISYINKQGGCRSPRLHSIARMIVSWLEENKVWVYASYINTKCNIIADRESRMESDDSDWQLNRSKFIDICKILNFRPAIDLFASQWTSQLHTYASWLPDPGASFVDAFTLDWSELEFYAFPPLCLVARVLRKIKEDKATGLVIVPWWRAQPWFPVYNSLVRSQIIMMGPDINLLHSFVTSSPHPLAQNLQLAAAILSGASI